MINKDELGLALEKIIVKAPEFIFWKDANSIYQGCNENFAIIAGLQNADQIIGKTDKELAWGIAASHIYLEEDKFILKTGQAIDQKELNLFTNHDRLMTVLVSKRPLFDDKSNVIGIFGLLVDITERKRKEVAQKDMKIFYESLIAQLPNYIYWLNRDCILEGGNNNLAEMLGLNSPAELRGLTYEQMGKRANWSKDQGEEFKATGLKIIRTGLSSLNKEEPPILINNKKKYFISNKVPNKDSQGNIIGVIGISTDITEHKEKQNLLKDYNKLNEIRYFYENIISQLPNNIYWLDPYGILQGGNNNLAKIFGFSSSMDLKGLTHAEMCALTYNTNEVGESFRQAELDIMETGIARLNYEEPPVIIDGEIRYYISSKVPLYNLNNQIIGLLGISTDITERKAYEKNLKKAKQKAEASNKAKTEFLMNMRHDIRTPLTGIIGFAELVKDKARDPEITQYAENMLVSSHVLLEFLNDILDAVKISGGEVPLLTKKFNLQEKLLSIFTLNQAKAKQKHLNFSFEYDPQLPLYFLGDWKRLQRILLELLSNALRFTDEGAIRVKVEFAEKESNYITLKLIVNDTGIGIPEDKLEEVFVRFTRLSPSYEGVYKGIGIGLTVIKQFIEDLKGEIYVESELGKGSTFTCILRLKKALLEHDEFVDREKLISAEKIKSIISTPKNTLLPKPAFSTDKRILVVEDSSLAAQVVRGLLEGLNCQVDIASDGKSGLEKAKQHPYDIIFMDIGLPLMNGNEVTLAFREWEKRQDPNRHIPIMALSAHTEDQEKQKSLKAGMDEIFSKPLTKEQALAIFERYIPRKISSKTLDKSLTSSQTNELHTINATVVNFDKAIAQGSDLKTITHLLSLFVSTFPQEKERLLAAYQQKDWTTIKDIAHGFKGNCIFCAADRLHIVSGQLESYLKSKKRPLREALFQQLLQEMDNLLKTFQTLSP